MKTLVQLTNEIAIREDGWAMLAPYGDFPNVAWVNGDEVPAIQRVDREAGELLVRDLKSLHGKAARYFRSIPLYNGHPDVPALAEKYQDLEPVGHVGDLQMRTEGIFIRPILNERGATLLNEKARLGLSAYVDAEIIAKSGDTLITRWLRLKSVGLTNNPNLPVDLINEQTGQAQQTMNQQLIIAALAAVGVQLANSASEDAVVSAIRTLADQRTQALNQATARESELEPLKAERDQLRTTLANEQAARRKDLLDERVTSGAITEADRSMWERRLTADFANEVPVLKALRGVVKTQTAVSNAGDRRADASGSDASNSRMAEAKIAEVQHANTGMTYQRARDLVRAQHPELFGLPQGS